MTAYEAGAGAEHTHTFQGQKLTHTHVHDFPHGYYEHPEDGHRVTYQEHGYTVTWSYETHKQDMTPQEAADLAADVFLTGTDPAAHARGHVQVSVVEYALNAPHVEHDHGEYEVTIPARPTVEDIATLLRLAVGHFEYRAELGHADGPSESEAALLARVAAAFDVPVPAYQAPEPPEPGVRRDNGLRLTEPCDDGHRPDDMPEPGDRCKDCHHDLTWVGPELDPSGWGAVCSPEVQGEPVTCTCGS